MRKCKSCFDNQATRYIFPGDPKKQIPKFALYYCEHKKVWIAVNIPKGTDISDEQLLPDNFSPRPISK